MKFIGKLGLDTQVDITDPCYDKGTWCRKTETCTPGLYYGYVTEYDNRISSISIYLDNEVQDVVCENNCIGFIAVDAGLAGFFNNKQDFNDEEWREFCSNLDRNKDYHEMYNGLFARSGWGDGSYEVYTNEKRTAFTIVFIDEDKENRAYINRLEQIIRNTIDWGCECGQQTSIDLIKGMCIFPYELEELGYDEDEFSELYRYADINFENRIGEC